MLILKFRKGCICNLDSVRNAGPHSLQDKILKIKVKNSMYNWPQRKKLRLENFDYSSNWYYFVTICTKNRDDYFGEIIDWKMILNDFWKIAENEILKTEEIRKEIKIDMFVIMPNHLHLLIAVESAKNDIARNAKNDIVGNAGPRSLPNQNTGPVGIAGPHSLQDTKSHLLQDKNDFTKNKLSNTIQRIKSSITLNIRKKYDDFTFAWHKSFHDKIVRNDEQLNNARQYILDNPMKWELDENNQINIK